MEMRNIAVIIDRYFRGGVALALQVLLQELVRENYRITLFVRDLGMAQLLPLPEGVTCCSWGDGKLFSPDNWLCSLINWRNAGKRKIFQTRCRQDLPGEYDCAIAYHMVVNDVAIMALEKIKAKRKILWVHNKKTFCNQDLAFYDDLYSKADKIVCVSLETEERFKGLMPRCAGRTVTIHNLYDIPVILRQAQLPAEDMDVSGGAVKIVSVGRISKEKGFDRVAEVARRLTDEGYDIRWYIVGDGNTRADVEADIREKRVEDRVILLGHRTNPYPYVANCDIYVQPSYTEGFCTSTMEAKILCKPVVTTDVPGMREQFVSGENGLIVESSADGIYEGIKALLDDPALRERMMEKLRTEPVSNEDVLRQTMEVIDGVK